jgi:PAS domain S-box-containing protein
MLAASRYLPINTAHDSTHYMAADERDIKTLWAAIAGREARLLALVKASAQIVWVTDRNGKVLPDVDPPPEIADLTWSNFTGLSQEALHGHGWLNALHPDDLKVMNTVGGASRASGAPIDAEFRVRHRSGEWRWMICRGSAMRRENGEILGWVGSCTDITASKLTEAAHRESQQRLLAALDAGEMSTWIWHIADHTFYWDEAGTKLWDRVGMTDTHDLSQLVQLVHPDEREAVSQACAETVATGVARSVEFRTLRRDGQLQWLSSRGRVEKDAAGVPVRVIGAFVDITKLKTAEESLRQAQKMQALGTLAGGIAHDFNNLLLAISGNARLGLSELDEHDPSHRYFQEIAKAGARASDLVRRILTFSARRPPAHAVTPLKPAIEEALTLLQSSVPANVRIRTHFEIPVSCTLAQAELQQIIVNLVNNAIHAIGVDGGRIEITVDIEPDDAAQSRGSSRGPSGQARILIHDSGCGMNMATAARIFEPFFTTKPAGEGTGLGLAVVHGIVHGCGGSITVQSELGSGTSFVLRLPLAFETLAQQRPAAITSTASGHGERVLYVDDDEAVNFLVQRLLEKAGYHVTCCDDPRIAQRLFDERGSQFDVVVTDLTMPAMSGFDLIHELRAAGARVPFIMTSGYVRDEDQARAHRIGIGRIILKPDTVDELGRELDTRCRELRLQREGA